MSEIHLEVYYIKGHSLTTLKTKQKNLRCIWQSKKILDILLLDVFGVIVNEYLCVLVSSVFVQLGAESVASWQSVLR